MDKFTNKFEFKLKEELCLTTIEECGEEMTPVMRVIKKCTNFIDDFYHNPDDEYENKFASHTKEPDGNSELFAINFSYIDDEGYTYASYSYFVTFNYITKIIELNFITRNKENAKSIEVIQKLTEIFRKLVEKFKVAMFARC